MARAAKAKVATPYDQLTEAVGTNLEPYDEGEEYGDFVARVCEAISKLPRKEYAKLPEPLKKWSIDAFESVNAEEPDKAPFLEGFPVQRPEEDEEDEAPAKPKAKGKVIAAKGKAKAKVAEPDEDEDEDEDESDEDEDEDDDEDEDEVPVVAKGKKGKLIPPVVAKGKAKTTADDIDDSDLDEDDDDDEEEAPVVAKKKVKAGPVPLSTKVKGKAKVSLADEDEDDDDDDEGEDDDEEDAAPPARKGRPPKAAAPAKPKRVSANRRFRELVLTNLQRSYERVVKMARKEGITAADSHLMRIYSNTLDVVKAMERLELFSREG